MNFSVLMSVYGGDNAQDFKTALESVTVNQITKPLQVVIVQDGIVPPIFDEIIEEVKQRIFDIEFLILKKSKNEGLAAALNDGLALCKYDWVARMDSDDISTPDRFKKQIAFLEENTDISVLGGAIAEFKNIVGDICSERHVKLTHNEIKQMAKFRTPMNHVSVMYKRNEILEVGGYNKNFGKLEDYKLWVDLIIAGKTLANIDDVIVNVRIGNGFIIRRSNKQEIADWDMLQNYLLKENVISKLQALKNKIYIRIFIYMPAWMKKITYKTLLRKKNRL
ncbi:MAG: glycosyltransferase [Clostridia bacterium]|nr:glycosyltransferase [Clostridia bacterium]